MSFLTRTALRAPRTIAFAPRAFSTSFISQKSATETVKETVHAADKAVAGKIVDGIEVGRKSPSSLLSFFAALYFPVQISSYANERSTTEQASAKVKEAAGMSSGEAKGKAEELKGEAKGKAAELKGQAQGKAEEIKGKM